MFTARSQRSRLALAVHLVGDGDELDLVSEAVDDVQDSEHFLGLLSDFDLVHHAGLVKTGLNRGFNGGVKRG